MCCALDDVPFIPKFVFVTKSEYRNEASFIVADQKSALITHCTDLEVKEIVSDLQLKSPDIYPLNPCHYGFFFSGVEIAGISGYIM